MIQAVIFDIDGTLVDSNDLHAQAWQEAFAHFGVHLPFERIRFQIGKGGDQLIPALLSKEQVEEIGKDADEYRSDLFKRNYLPRVRAFPDVRNLFLRLIGEGRRVALASSAKGDELDKYKKIAGISDLVEEQTSADDADKSKPYPDIFEAALARLGLQSDHAIVIGDTPYDAQAAAKIHLRTIGVLSGGFPEEELRQAGCVEIFQNISDLLKNYEKSALAESSQAA